MAKQGFLQWLLGRFLQKQSRTFRVILGGVHSDNIWRPADYEAFAREGYSQNIYVAASINTVAKAAAAVPLLLFSKNKDGTLEEITDHALLDLLNRPNPYMGSVKFIENLTGYFLVAGSGTIAYQ